MTPSGMLGHVRAIPRAWRVATFVVFALALFTATHWPNLRIESDLVRRPDLFIHASVFAGWTLLLWFSGLLGPLDRLRTVPRIAFVGVAYAAFDEATQAIPLINRTAAVDDFLANCLGVAIGSGLAALTATLLRHGTARDSRVKTGRG